MIHVLVVGAGLAGCTIAKELVENNLKVTLVESRGSIGGKVEGYGCKATDKCASCGVCLSTGLWEAVESAGIDIKLSTKLVDLYKDGGKYHASLKGSAGTITVLKDIDRVVVATGFAYSARTTGISTNIMSGFRIITGGQLEAILKERSTDRLFNFISPDTSSDTENVLDSVAFVQCYGSRDIREHAMYCSRVCCGYSTRAALAMKHFYDCRVAIFCMDLQSVNPGEYRQQLLDSGIEFIKCRLVDVKDEINNRPVLSYEDPATGQRVNESFDLIVLSEGITPHSDARHTAEICGLGQDEAGFLNYAGEPDVLLAGCVSGPKKIEETHFEALAVAKKILLEAL